MTIGRLVKDRLTGYAGISALVSTRVYPGRLPQRPTYPAISYKRISNAGANGSTALRESRWQFDCWDMTYGGAHELAVQVKTAFEEFSDVGETPGIKQSYVVNEIDDDDWEAGKDDEELHRTIVEVMLVTIGD